MPNPASKPGIQKANMLNVARKLFRYRGYNATGMRDMDAAYGCKPATIYNFFPNKEQILFELVCEEMDHIISPLKHPEQDAVTSQ